MGSAYSPIGSKRRQTNEGHRRSRPPSVRKAVISMGVIDEKSVTRECITKCLQALDERLDIVTYATCDDCLRHMKSHDLVLYHVHEDMSAWNANSQQLI